MHTEQDEKEHTGQNDHGSTRETYKEDFMSFSSLWNTD